MAKIYTAYEMRQTANAEELVGRPNVAEMLRQAADALEREGEREKMYEYAAKYKCGFVSGAHFNTANRTAYARSREDFDCVVRRPVGEWEEVKDA